MSCYVIEREVPGVAKLSADDLRGISQTSWGVLRKLGPQIQWVHSYVTAGREGEAQALLAQCRRVLLAGTASLRRILASDGAPALPPVCAAQHDHYAHGASHGPQIALGQTMR